DVLPLHGRLADRPLVAGRAHHLRGGHHRPPRRAGRRRPGARRVHVLPRPDAHPASTREPPGAFHLTSTSRTRALQLLMTLALSLTTFLLLAPTAARAASDEAALDPAQEFDLPAWVS